MSQHDYNIANAPGAAVRADMNDALGAVATRNSGATAPSTTFAYQVWVDTASGTIKHRNGANSGWLVDSTADETRILSRSSNTMLDVSDIGKTIRASSAFTQTFDAVAALTDGWFVEYVNESSGVVTLDPNSSETIDGATTLALQPGHSCTIVCNGSNLKTVGLSQLPAVLAQEQASTSGTSIDFTGIPAWVKRITVQFNGVSTNGSDNLVVQVGDAGGIETSGYTSSSAQLTHAFSPGVDNSTTGFLIKSPGSSSAFRGHMVLTLEDASDNTWIATSVLSASGTDLVVSGGAKALSATLDRVRITTVLGSNTFDAGAVNILYE